MMHACNPAQFDLIDNSLIVYCLLSLQWPLQIQQHCCTLKPSIFNGATPGQFVVVSTKVQIPAWPVNRGHQESGSLL